MIDKIIYTDTLERAVEHLETNITVSAQWEQAVLATALKHILELERRLDELTARLTHNPD